MECEPCIEWFLIEYWMIINSVSFDCPFEWFCLGLRVCLIDFIWIKLFDWFVDLFSNTCLITLCTLTMHSLVQLLPQDLAHGIGAAVLCFLGSPMEIKHNTPRVRAQQIPNFCFNYLTMLGSPTPCTYHHARPEDCFFAVRKTRHPFKPYLKNFTRLQSRCEYCVSGMYGMFHGAISRSGTYLVF